MSFNTCVNLKLFPAQRQDSKTVEELWTDWPWEKIEFVVADKGYDSCAVRNFIKLNNAVPVIPRKGIYVLPDSNLTPNDFYDIEIYNKRNIIERMFSKLKENKRIAMRYDKLDFTFMNFIIIAIIKALNLFC